GFLQRLSERLAFFEGLSDFHQGLLDDGVARGSGGDVQTFQNGHAAGDQRSQGSSKAGDGDLPHQHAHNRQLQNDGIHNQAALRRAVPDFQPDDDSDKGEENQEPEYTSNEVAECDDDSRGKRKVHAKACEQGCENGNDFPEEQYDDGTRDGQDAYRVDQGRFHSTLQFDVLFDVRRKTLKNGVENTARLARFHHVHVQGVEDFRRAAHGGGKRCASFNLGARAGQDFLKDLILLLARKNLETLHQRKTGVNHDRELAREDGQLLGIDAATKCGDIEFLPLLGHFCGGNLLALQNARQFRLVRCSHHSANAGAAAARSLVFVIRHENCLLNLFDLPGLRLLSQSLTPRRHGRPCPVACTCHPTVNHVLQFVGV